MTIESSVRPAGTAGPTARQTIATARRDRTPRSGTVVLAPGLRVVERDDRTLQIGIEPPRRILVRHPPPGTLDVLRLLSRGVPLAAATRRIAVARGVPPSNWDDVVDALLADGFLIHSPDPGTGARSAAVSRVPAEPPWAESAGSGLADAVTVIVGTGRVASSLATLLAAAGTGHVHLDPDRALRPGDAAPAGPTPDELADVAAVLAFDPARRHQDHLGLEHHRSATAADRTTLAAVVRRARPGVAVHRPAGYVRPGLVVLATDGPPGPEVVHRLVSEGQPHLAVHAGEHRGVVGPLVLPGRTSCLHCHDLHRRDADAGWPRVLLELRHAGVQPPVVLATSVAALAAEQALQFLGGRRPAAVDGTLESTAGDWRVRRRSWRAHPACFCTAAVMRLRPAATAGTMEV